MEQWVQYVLDTCATVDEVVESAQAVAIDGWNWHFYVVDKTGDSAVIEFLDGESAVRRGRTLPQPLLCNSIYDEEMARLTSYQGFGGNLAVELNNPEVPRFVQGAYLLRSFTPDEDPTAYGFMILKTMSRGTTKWSKIVDLHKKRVTFSTDVNPRLRHVDLDSLDFSCKTPRLVLDIHADLSGDVHSSFREYTADANRRMVEETIAGLAKLSEFEPIIESMGGTREGLISRFCEYPGTTDCK